MDVLVVCEYLEIKKNRTKLESQFKKLEKELVICNARESGLRAKVNLNGLITAKAVNIINSLLGRQPLWLYYNDELFPVSFVRVSRAGNNLRVSIVFTQPIFCGWRTETPCVSYQSCPLSLVTPEPPDENHIAQYHQVTDAEYGIVCWEQDKNELRLWVDEKRKLVFRWSDE